VRNNKMFFLQTLAPITQDSNNMLNKLLKTGEGLSDSTQKQNSATY